MCWSQVLLKVQAELEVIIVEPPEHNPPFTLKNVSPHQIGFDDATH